MIIILNSARLTDLHAIHGHSGKVVRVLFVPAEAEEWVVLGVFINDGAVLQVTKVEHTDRTVSSNRGKHISTTTCSAEGYVINLQRQQRDITKNSSSCASIILIHIHKFHYTSLNLSITNT